MSSAGSDAPADSLSLFSQAQVSPSGVITNPVLTAPLTLTFGVGGPSVLTMTQSPAGGNRGLIDFAPGFVPRQQDAGKIGYNAFTADRLDIVGSGTGPGVVRGVRIWDNLHVGSSSGALTPSDGGVALSGPGAELRLHDRSNQAVYTSLYNDTSTVGVFNIWNDVDTGAKVYLNVFIAFANSKCELRAGTPGPSGSYSRHTFRDQWNSHTRNMWVDSANTWHKDNAAADSVMIEQDDSNTNGYYWPAAGGLTNTWNSGATGWGSGYALNSGSFSFHAVLFPTSSDRRLKKNVKPLKDALEKVRRLRGVTYQWRNPIEDHPHHPNNHDPWRDPLEVYGNHLGSHPDGYDHIGFIGQEVAEVLPEVVSLWNKHRDQPKPTPENSYFGLDYGRIVPVLVEAVKELADRLERLEAKA